MAYSKKKRGNQSAGGNFLSDLLAIDPTDRATYLFLKKPNSSAEIDLCLGLLEQSLNDIRKGTGSEDPRLSIRANEELLWMSGYGIFAYCPMNFDLVCEALGLEPVWLYEKSQELVKKILAEQTASALKAQSSA